MHHWTPGEQVTQRFAASLAPSGMPPNLNSIDQRITGARPMTHVLINALGTWPVRRVARYGRFRDHPARHAAADREAPLGLGEHVLVRTGERTRPIVGTKKALYVRGDHEQWERMSWSDIATIGWSRLDQSLQLRMWSNPLAAPPRRFRVDARFAAFAEERVSATRLLCTQVEILPDVVGTVVAVRSADDDIVRWHIDFQHPDQRDDRDVRDACARIIAEVSSLAGC
jgi:hypothetical protein